MFSCTTKNYSETSEDKRWWCNKHEEGRPISMIYGMDEPYTLLIRRDSDQSGGTGGIMSLIGGCRSN